MDNGVLGPAPNFINTLPDGLAVVNGLSPERRQVNDRYHFTRPTPSLEFAQKYPDHAALSCADTAQGCPIYRGASITVANGFNIYEWNGTFGNYFNAMLTHRNPIG